MTVYGYTRISTKKQNIERQKRNIYAVYPNAVMVEEEFTGTKFQGREKLDKLLEDVKTGDTIIFDSVSRMSRNAEEGFKLYEQLFDQGVELVFLKEPHINTATYKNALKNNIEMTRTPIDSILEGINKYLLTLAKEQIRIAFDQAEKEVEDLHQRTREGIVTARLNGKQIGQRKGAKLHIKKAEPAKEKIRKFNKDFGGQLNNQETWELIGISKMTFYKYKREIMEEMAK